MVNELCEKELIKWTYLKKKKNNKTTKDSTKEINVKLEAIIERNYK